MLTLILAFVALLLVVAVLRSSISPRNANQEGNNLANLQLGGGAAVAARSRSPRQERSYEGLLRFSIEQHEPPSPQQATRESAQCWIGANSSVEVQGRTLSGGFLYVGSKMRGLHRWRDSADPSLIDPALPVSRSATAAADLDYYPSYSDLTPPQRTRYLAWLDTGRKHPSVPLGYVFLYFYGLERRIVLDCRHLESARSSIGELLDEIDRLLTIYGENPSFRHYASELLAFGHIAYHGGINSPALDKLARRSGRMPTALKIALGKQVAAGDPIAPKLALAWLHASPRSSLRTPARRCRDEFDALFLLRYLENYHAGGFRIRPNKTPLRFHYRPASSGLDSPLPVKLPALPDVFELAAPNRKLDQIATSVCNELDGYSRWVGRNDDLESPVGVALLPVEIASGRGGEQANRIRTWCEVSLGDEERSLVDAAELISSWPTKSDGKLTKTENTQFLDFLSRQGIQVEPDARGGGLNLSRCAQAVLFRLETAADTEISDAFRVATLVLHLACALSAADGQVSQDEEQLLVDQLDSMLGLSTEERSRLQAHLMWLLADQPSLSGLKKRLEKLAEVERRNLARFLLAVAAADGRIEPGEITLLRKVYPWLGLDAEEVISDLHSLTSAGTAPTGPVKIRAARPAKGSALPTTGAREPTFALDPARVDALLENSKRAQSLLSAVLAEDEPPPDSASEASSPRAEPAGSDDGGNPLGLDAPHAELLHQLGTRSSWSTEEVERLAHKLDLLPDGALEEINEAAIDHLGDPLLESGDGVEMDLELYREAVS